MAQAEQIKNYDVSAKKFFQAVTSYEKYPDFVDGLKRSTVDRSQGKIIVQNDISMMSKEMSYTIDVTENEQNGTVSWTLVKSDFFKVNNGSWLIRSTGENSCEVKYSLEVEFNFSVPGLILKGLVKGTLPTMMNSFYKRAQSL